MSALAAIRGVGSNRGLRRLELAWLGSSAGDWAYSLALAVYAYRQGGATAVGLLALVRLSASALAGPFVAVLADRHDRIRVMVSADLARVATVGIVALVAWRDGPAFVVYGLAVLTSLIGPAFGPARAAITPSLARTPEELTAANVVAATTESTSSFIGPAIGGLLVAQFGTALVFALDAATFAWSAALIIGLRPVAAAGASSADEPAGAGGDDEPVRLLDGFRTILGNSRLRVLLGLYTLQTLVCGFLNVFTVIVGFELLRGGPATVGFLDAAAGVGGIVGSIAAVGLIGRRLSTGFAVGLVFWSAPMIVIGLVPNRPVALASMAVLGVANTVVDVAAYTLLQRAVPQRLLGRVFGVAEALFSGSVAIGSALAPAIVGLIALRPSLVVVGSLLPVAALLSWRALVKIDAEATVPPALELLAGVPFLAVLDAGTLERLATGAERVEVPAGTNVIEAGEVGDRFYVIGSGSVTILGQAFGRGESFGEIALLRDVPRTATVTAVDDAVLFAIEREPFVDAVTGRADAASSAEAVVGARLLRR